MFAPSSAEVCVVVAVGLLLYGQGLRTAARHDFGRGNPYNDEWYRSFIQVGTRNAAVALGVFAFVEVLRLWLLDR